MNQTCFCYGNHRQQLDAGVSTWYDEKHASWKHLKRVFHVSSSPQETLHFLPWVVAEDRICERDLLH